MNELKITIDDAQVRQALERMPDVVVRHVDSNLWKGSQALAVTARHNASAHDAFATNREAIHARKLGPLHFQVVAGSNYARALEEGTGPAAGKRAYMPDPEKLQDYIKRRHRITFTGRRDSRKRRGQEREIRERAWGMARAIAKHGTEPYPFMAPALEEHRSRLHQLVQEGAIAGAAAVFRGSR